jgi:D-aminopeptidase
VPRAADLPIRIGLLPSGPTASVHDVPGVGLGHAELILDEPDPPAGRGVVRTGVGDCTGFLSLVEWGRTEPPVFLTSTLQVGRVFDAACSAFARRYPRAGVDDVMVPVVAECDDSGLSEPRWAKLSDDDVRRAWQEAEQAVGSPRPPREGCVGAGTGMQCLGYKGGIGTASRLLPDGHVLGAVVLTNFGVAERLTVAGRPIPLSGNDSGDRPADDEPAVPGRGDRGSCIVVLVTDGPLDAHGCGRLARRAGLGLARVGSVGSHGSGEIFLALATGLRGDRVQPAPGTPVSAGQLNPYFAAAVEATEEAVVTSLLAATTTTGRGGRTVAALQLDDVRRALTGG